MVDEFGEIALERFVLSLKCFAPAQEAVADDLGPLAVALDDPEDHAYVSTQIYEEAQHARFFDRYWREVIHPAQDELGRERSYPRRWKETPSESMIVEYTDFFTRIWSAVEALLEDDSPEMQPKALCHDHLVGEGIGTQNTLLQPALPLWARHRPGDTKPPQLHRRSPADPPRGGAPCRRGDEQAKEFVPEGNVEPELILGHRRRNYVAAAGSHLPTEKFAHLPDLPEGASEEFALEKHEERM
jgi:ribonucleoside-diphosphate reductase beta chain